MKKKIALFLSAFALAIGVGTLTSKASVNKASAYDGLDCPALKASLDTSSALVFERDTEQTSIAVSDMVPYVEDGSEFFEFGTSGDYEMISEKTANKKYHAIILPVSFYIHLEAKQQVSFSELDLQITAYKTTSNGSAACVTELFYDMPTIINGSDNNTLSEYSLVRGYSSSTTHVNTPYHYGEYTFTNNSDQEADVYLPGTYYFAMIVRWASSYDHLGHGLVGFGNKYCADNHKLNDRDIQIEFDNENTVYYRQSGSDASSINYSDMIPVEFNNGENEIFDASINDRLAVFKEKSMNKYFNLILIPFRFYVNLDAYEMVTVSEFNVILTIRKIASGGIAGSFVELFSDRPSVITTTWNAASSPSYSIGRVSTSSGSSNEANIHDRLAKNCSCDGYSFANNSDSNQNIYTSNYYYLAICGNYASTWDHMIEGTMNVVPAEGDSVVSYTRLVTFNGTSCSIDGGNTANYQTQYIATIVPDEHYTYPSTVQILMGGVALSTYSQYTYNSSTGEITIKANVVTDDIVINATAVPATYTISYVSNGGSGSTSNSTGTYGQVILLRNSSFTRKYYSFLEWNTQDDGLGISYNAGDDYTVFRDATLYAIWYQTDRDLVDQFVGIELHFDVDVISTSDNSDTGACRGENGLYSIAKAAYNNLTGDQKELFCENSRYTNARARLNAWAVANGEVLNTSAYELQQASRAITVFDKYVENGGGLTIVIIIGLFGLISLCAFFYIQNRRKEK